MTEEIVVDPIAISVSSAKPPARRPAGSRQNWREDPTAPKPLALKPSMCLAVAVHPGHPSANGPAYRLFNQMEAEEGDPVLIRVPLRHVWDEENPPLPVLPGSGVNLKLVGYMVVDGVRRIRDAWERGETIRAVAISPEQAEPYLRANEERRSKQPRIPDLDCEAIATAFHEAGLGQKKPFLQMGQAVTALREAGLSPTKGMEILRISHSVYYRSKALYAFWAQVGVSPDALNCYEYLPLDVAVTFEKRLNAKYDHWLGPLGPQVTARIIPHVVQALVEQTEDLRATFGRDIPPFQSPTELANTLCELVFSCGQNALLAHARTQPMDEEALSSLTIADLPGHVLAEWCRMAVARAYWQNMIPGWIMAARTRKVPLEVAFLFAGSPTDLQVKALNGYFTRKWKHGGTVEEVRSWRRSLWRSRRAEAAKGSLLPSHEESNNIHKK